MKVVLKMAISIEHKSWFEIDMPCVSPGIRMGRRSKLWGGQVLKKNVQKFLAGANAPRAVALNALVGNRGPTNTPVVLFLSFGDF